MMTDENEPLFHSAHAAVRWALSDERVALQQVSTYRGPGSGRSLSGFDGAAQAGIILSHVHRLERPRNLIVSAQEASTKLPCACRRDCCSGWRSNPVWTAAVSGVAEWYVEIHDPHGRHRRIIAACLRRFFGERINLETIGKRSGVSKALACEVNGIVLGHLKPLKESAWEILEEGLASAGLIEAAASRAVA